MTKRKSSSTTARTSGEPEEGGVADLGPELHREIVLLRSLLGSLRQTPLQDPTRFLENVYRLALDMGARHDTYQLYQIILDGLQEETHSAELTWVKSFLQANSAANVRAGEVEFFAGGVFYELNRDRLLRDYEGKFIAIVSGDVVDSDEDFEKLAVRVYQRFGYRDIFMPKVERKPRTIRIPSPRLRA